MNRSRFLGLAKSYFFLCREVCREIIKHDNETCVAFREGEEEEAKEAIRWSDAKMVVPLLFNFYHGLELFMKAILLKPDGSGTATHDLGVLFQELKKGGDLPADVQGILEKYLRPPSLIQEWMRENEISGLDKLLEFLRYPTDRNFSKTIKHLPLRYQGKEGLPFFQELAADLQALIGFHLPES